MQNSLVHKIKKYKHKINSLNRSRDLAGINDLRTLKKIYQREKMMGGDDRKEEIINMMNDIIENDEEFMKYKPGDKIINMCEREERNTHFILCKNVNNIRNNGNVYATKNLMTIKEGEQIYGYDDTNSYVEAVVAQMLEEENNIEPDYNNGIYTYMFTVLDNTLDFVQKKYDEVIKPFFDGNHDKFIGEVKVNYNNEDGEIKNIIETIIDFNKILYTGNENPGYLAYIIAENFPKKKSLEKKNLLSAVEMIGTIKENVDKLKLDKKFRVYHFTYIYLIVSCYIYIYYESVYDYLISCNGVSSFIYFLDDFECVRKVFYGDDNKIVGNSVWKEKFSDKIMEVDKDELIKKICPYFFGPATVSECVFSLSKKLNIATIMIQDRTVKCQDDDKKCKKIFIGHGDISTTSAFMHHDFTHLKHLVLETKNKFKHDRIYDYFFYIWKKISQKNEISPARKMLCYHIFNILHERHDCEPGLPFSESLSTIELSKILKKKNITSEDKKIVSDVITTVMSCDFKKESSSRWRRETLHMMDKISDHIVDKNIEDLKNSLKTINNNVQTYNDVCLAILKIKKIKEPEVFYRRFPNGNATWEILEDSEKKLIDMISEYLSEAFEEMYKESYGCIGNSFIELATQFVCEKK